MQKWLVPAFFITLITAISFSQNRGGSENENLQILLQDADKKFHKADNLANDAGEDNLKIKKADSAFRIALVAYQKLLLGLNGPQNDSAYIIAATNTGIIYHYFDSTELALKHYLAAAHKREVPSRLQDSIYFQALLFSGSIFYNNGEYDSSVYYLKKAEEVKSKYEEYLKEENRLYNLLGVVYYENGNFKQSLNYVRKALELHNKMQPQDKELAANYKLNIASILIKLDDYTAAEKLLLNIKSENFYPNETLHKLGFIKFRANKFTEAIQLFNEVKYAGGKKQIELLNNISKAYSELDKKDSAHIYLLKAKAEALSIIGNKKTITAGTLLKTEADLLVADGEYKKALEYYQFAIVNFCGSFNDSAIYANPQIFSSAFAYIDLFNTLIAKADAFNNLYAQSKNIGDLEGAVNSYSTAFSLASYVEKTYDSDEARLFLNNMKYINHSKPIELTLKLYELTGKKKYMEQTYYFDQQNKASILALNVTENKLKGHSPATDELLQKAYSVKSTITRLSLKAFAITDSSELRKLSIAIQDEEIELSKLQQKIKEDPAWQQMNLREQVPSVSSIQKKIDNSTAIVSWHKSETEIVSLIITRGKFDVVRIPITNDLLPAIESFKKSLYTIVDGVRFDGAANAKKIYRQLFSPIQAKLTGIERLVIIPDDELHYLPFEALQDEENNYLLQRYSIQYLWSTALFQHTPKYNTTSGILSFAPFANKSYTDSNGYSFTRLAASASEVGDLPGQVLLNEKATKQSFLSFANRYPVIHLATHASVNNIDPGQSYIAFYPETDSGFKLYAKEIYDMQLDSAQLLILSACETGSGQLVKGEGLMSLSRAFTYAGCSDIITSLWKAEDNTTSYLTQKIHAYLAKGMTNDKALQQARLDFLNDKRIDSRFKTPNYWAHLIFIGSYEASSHSSNWPWVALAIIILAFVYRWLMKKAPLQNQG